MLIAMGCQLFGLIYPKFYTIDSADINIGIFSVCDGLSKPCYHFKSEKSGKLFLLFLIIFYKTFMYSLDNTSNSNVDIFTSYFCFGFSIATIWLLF
jgi:hypothetical protein